MAKVKLDVSGLPTDAELKQMFDAVPKLKRHNVADAVVTAGSQPVLTRARQLAPRSTQADRDKRSKKQKAAADWDYPLWKTIKRVVRKYAHNAIAIIGPEWPKGNKAYFNTSPRGRQQKLWGKSTGKTVAQIRNWIAQALDEAKPAALAKMKETLQKKMREIWGK